MAPFKSSLARSVGKLFGVSNQQDLSLRGATQSGRKRPPSSFSATGGTKFTPGDGFHYHVIISSTPAPTRNIVATEGAGSVPGCSILIVGGGGGGAGIQGPGGAAGGGGGAGGMLYATNIQLPLQATNPISIGAGGAISPPAYSETGSLGGDTTIALGNSLTLTGKGGGGGAMYDIDGSVGGSGGGAAYVNAVGGGTTQVPANPGPFQPYCFGNAGGDGNPQSPIYNGAGGGGAGSAGADAPGSSGGPGGDGKSTVFTSPLFPGMDSTFLTAIGSNGKFAQGGSGGTYSPNVGGTSGYAGGGGGGGGGPSNDSSPADQKSGVDNTGSGGGAGDGGDGIVIFKYPVTAKYSG